MDSVQIVRQYYNEDVEGEWNRIAGRPEFLLTCKYLDRYVKPGDTVLDIGGGPGRYSLYLAGKGAEVTLFDLSDANVQFAAIQAKAEGVALRAERGDAREVDALISLTFDHVLLMGPMYHLLKESDRIKAVNASLNLLKPDGILFVSFIAMFAGMIYSMKFDPDIILDQSEAEFHRAVINNTSYAGQAFTQAFFINQREVLPFMSGFPLEKLHLFGQESIMSPCEDHIMSKSPEVISAWLDIAEKLCEHEELLSWSEHLMYVGRKL